MNSVNPQEFKKIVEKLVSETSCPVCFNAIRSPVHLCTNGHGFCGKCRVELDKCPMCRQPFSPSTSRNILLNGVLDLLPHLCRFDGCHVFVKMEDDHEKWCGHHTTSCKLFNCQWTGCGKDILDHIKTSHENTDIMNEENLDWSYTKVNLSQKSYFPLFAQGHFFWVHRRKLDDKTIAVDFVHIPNGRIKNSFKITMSFSNSKTSHSSSIYVTSENVFNKDDISMSFVYSKVQSLINSEGNLPYSLVVVKD